ncbi:MAG: phosphopantothenoylcysteine decarboxylase [Pseudomonadota bacterium]
MRPKHNKKLRILITAGPTREYIDPVRYISNDSSGQMGFALARAAAHLGFRVDLIAGPVALPTPEGAIRIDVASTLEMRREVMRLAPRADVIVMAAAVSDWRPARFSRKKIKRSKTGLPPPSPPYKGGEMPHAIPLIENPDILLELGKRKKPNQILIGFALETDDLEKNARGKLARKNCDWIVANPACAIGARVSRALLISRSGKKIALPLLPKEDLAIVILSHILGV